MIPAARHTKSAACAPTTSRVRLWFIQAHSFRSQQVSMIERRVLKVGFVPALYISRRSPFSSYSITTIVSLPSDSCRVDVRRSHYSGQHLAFEARIGYPLNKDKRSPKRSAPAKGNRKRSAELDGVLFNQA